MKTTTKVITALTTSLVLASALTPMTSVFASENEPKTEQTQQLSIIDQSNIESEVIYQDQEGNIFTKDEVIVQTGTRNPLISTRSITTSPISIGILFKYQNSTDANRMISAFRKAAAADGSFAVISGLLGVAAIPTSGITAVLAAMVAGIGKGVNSRFNEAANLVTAHKSGGKIYMYMDHVTYTK